MTALPQTLAEAHVLLKTQATLIEQQAKTIVRLEQRVQKLEARLNTNSQNSSKPPSSDGPQVPPKPSKPESLLKPGGQPGHPKHERQRVPVEEVTQVTECVPSRCRGCAAALSGLDAEPFWHQVVELPEVKAQVHEVRLHTLCCAHCGQRTRAPWPKGMAQGGFGPRVQAFVAMAVGAYRLSKRLVQRLLLDGFGVRISLGALSALERGVSEALERPYDEVAAFVRQAPVVNADETSWSEKGSKAWLWAAFTDTLALFRIDPKRDTAAAKALLGDNFAGVLGSDRCPAYTFVDSAQRQVCWAHLVRDFRAFAHHDGAEGKALSRSLLECCERLFHAWHKVRSDLRAGMLSLEERQSFETSMDTLAKDVEVALTKGTTLPRLAKKCAGMLKLQKAFWTFVRTPGVEPTNNAAERGVRHPVIWRKLCFGTQSPRGSLFVSRILTAVSSLRLQNRNVLVYLSDLCRAALDGSQSLPSLLPKTADTS
jgi:transposase